MANCGRPRQIAVVVAVFSAALMMSRGVVEAITCFNCTTDNDVLCNNNHDDMLRNNRNRFFGNIGWTCATLLYDKMYKHGAIVSVDATAYYTASSHGFSSECQYFAGPDPYLGVTVDAWWCGCSTNDCNFFPDGPEAKLASLRASLPLTTTTSSVAITNRPGFSCYTCNDATGSDAEKYACRMGYGMPPITPACVDYGFASGNSLWFCTTYLSPDSKTSIAPAGRPNMTFARGCSRVNHSYSCDSGSIIGEYGSYDVNPPSTYVNAYACGCRQSAINDRLPDCNHLSMDTLLAISPSLTGPAPATLSTRRRTSKTSKSAGGTTVDPAQSPGGDSSIGSRPAGAPSGIQISRFGRILVGILAIWTILA